MDKEMNIIENNENNSILNNMTSDDIIEKLYSIKKYEEEILIRQKSQITLYEVDKKEYEREKRDLKN